MGTSAKSSVAVLLCVVAVLAGTCASGANANVNILNLCTKNALVTVVPLKGILCETGILCPIIGNLSVDVKRNIGGTAYLLNIAVLRKLLKPLGGLNAIVKIDLICNGT